ncbi:hypothetical protein [Fischerella thermalis]|uniref:hypothetical protein n=1 Tax=Fischerella thermalis TaxID=372787 RepID=UPI0015E14969|nr:hypothetical protein [Fischerella thermalis]
MLTITLRRLFLPGDIEGFVALALENFVKLILIVTLCQEVLGFSPNLIYGRILPGIALSVCVGNCFYAWLAYHEGKRQSRLDMTALPYGVNTITVLPYMLAAVSGSCFPKIDLALIVWALLIFPMFITAQFLSISWITQTILWSLISFTGLLAMVTLSNYWLYKKGLIWLLYCWIVLMLCGLICTNYAIFFGCGELLVQICNLWLGLSAIGYLFTGIGVHSRALIFIGLLHIVAALLLPYFSSWQFLFTGIVMSFSLLLLAEFQWDMQN